MQDDRGSNIYNIFNTCILVEIVNNQFLTNFIPEIVNNSIENNEIINQKYSGNTTFYLINQLKKIDNIKDVQIIDVNSDSAGTTKGNVRIFIKKDTENSNINYEEVGISIYDNLNEGVVSLGDNKININRDGFIKNIKYSYSKDVKCSLKVEASPNNSWNGDLYSTIDLENFIYKEWLDYYSMQKQIQPQTFLRNLEMLANISFVFSYNGDKKSDFYANNGDYLVLNKEDIELTVG